MHRKISFTLLLLLVLLVGMLPTALAQGPAPSPPASGGPVQTGSRPPGASDEGTVPKTDETPAAPDGQGIQLVSAYTFASSSGTYTEITGGTVHCTGTACDDLVFNGIDLGFNFQYNWVRYTQVSLCTNGFLAMGPTAVSTYYPLSTGTSNNVISALGLHLQGNAAGELRSETIGTAPNRVYVLQFKDWRRYGGTESYNFQIRLHETTNVIEFVYGPFTKDATSVTAQVGLRGATNTDFNNRTTGPAPNYWTASLPGTLNSSSMTLNNTGSLPPDGLTYTWTPPQQPWLGASSKSAPFGVVIGDIFTYTVHIFNDGTTPANAATMTDPIPAGTTYIAGSVSCPSGSCSYNAGLNRIEWAGVVPAGTDIPVTFRVDTDGLACPTRIVNTATIADPQDPLGPVSRSAATTAGFTAPALMEGFEGSVFPPEQWGQTLVVGAYWWDRVNAGTNPTLTPHSGSWMARWNSNTIGSGNQTRLWTPALDLTTQVRPSLRFWMSHDRNFSTRDDRIQIQVSTDGGSNWTNVGAPISRYDEWAFAPYWKEHTVDLSAYAGLAGVQVGFLGISALGYNIFLDDVFVGELWAPCVSYVDAVPDQVGGACRGANLDYPLTIVNANEISDTLDLSWASSWPTMVAPDSVSLGPGGTAPAAAAVRIPWWAVNGDTDTAVIDVEAQTSGLTGAAQIRTTAWVAGGYSDYTDVPSGRRTRDHSLVYLNGKLYKFGGYGEPSAYAARPYVDIYDIASDTWSQGADMNIGGTAAPRYWIDCVPLEYDGVKIYCAGGYQTSGRTELLIYDPGTDTWTTGAALPAYRYAYAGVAYNNKYYVFGGYIAGGPTNTALVYDPALNAWTALPAMSQPRRYPSAGLINGKIYVAGGWINTANVGTLVTEVYDPATNTWSTVAPMPNTVPGGRGSVPGWARAADGVLHDRFLVMLGGAGVEGYATNLVLLYDASLNQWSWQANMPHLLYSAAADGDGNTLWLTGGYAYESGSTILSRYHTLVVECPACTGVTTADFTWDPAVPWAGLPVTFDATADGSPTHDYAWNWGDGITGTGDLVDHTYAAAGTYTVVLTATNCDGGNWVTATHDITVIAPPTIEVTPESLWAEQCPDTVTTQTLQICNGGDYTLTWSIQELTQAPPFGLEFIKAAQVAADVAPTSHVVRGPLALGEELFRTNVESGTRDNNSLGIERAAGFYGVTGGNNGVGMGDQVASGAKALAPGLVTDAVVFRGPHQAPSDPIGGYELHVFPNIPWAGEDPISGTLPPRDCAEVIVTFDSAGLAPGDHNGWLQIDSNDPFRPTVTVPLTLTVWEPANNADFSWSPELPHTGQVITFQGTAGGMAPFTFDWAFGDGITGTGQMITHTYTVPAFYTVTMTATNACGSASIQYLVEVLGMPAIVVDPPALAAALCPTATVTRTLEICNDGTYTLTWSLAELSGTQSLGRRPLWAFTLPAMPPVAGPAVKVPAPAQGPRSFTIASGAYPLASYQVLLLSPDSSMGDISLLLDTLAAYPDLVVTVWDNASGNPTAADLAPYDVVVIGNDYTWESAGLDKTLIGDALADYLDAGGKVIESEFVQSYDQWGFAGRYMTAGYSPFTPATTDYPLLTDTLDILSPTHPVMLGVDAVEDYRYQQDPGVATGAALLADWTSTGNHAVAVNDNVVALNLLIFHSADWSGDVGPLLHNAVVWLNQVDVPWLSEDPVNGALPISACQTVVVTFDATGMAPGEYNAGLAIASDDPEDPEVIVPVTMTIHALPVAAFDYTPDVGYFPLTVYFTNTSSAAISPTWTFGDGGIGAGDNVSHTYTAAGVYTATLTVQSPCGCGESTATGLVAVYSPGAPIPGFASSTPDCLGDTTYFTNTTVGTGTLTYLWAFGDGGTSTLENPTHIYAAAGAYTVILTATSSAGSAAVAHDVVIGAAPTAGFTYTVAGYDAIFTNASTGAMSYLWAFGDGGTSTETDPLHTYAANGIYTVTLTAYNDCGEDIYVDVVTIDVRPIRYSIYLPLVFKP